MDESVIKVTVGGAVCFSGTDAVSLYRAVILRSALGLLKVGICPTRGLTTKKAFGLVTEITGKTYKRHEFDRAERDLTVWIDTMKSAIPVVVD